MQVQLQSVPDHLQEMQGPVCGDVNKHHDGETWGPQEGDTGGADTSWQAICQLWHTEPLLANHCWSQARGG